MLLRQKHVWTGFQGVSFSPVYLLPCLIWGRCWWNFAVRGERGITGRQICRNWAEMVTHSGPKPCLMQTMEQLFCSASTCCLIFRCLCLPVTYTWLANCCTDWFLAAQIAAAASLARKWLVEIETCWRVKHWCVATTCRFLHFPKELSPLCCNLVTIAAVRFGFVKKRPHLEKSAPGGFFFRKIPF